MRQLTHGQEAALLVLEHAIAQFETRNDLDLQTFKNLFPEIANMVWEAAVNCVSLGLFTALTPYEFRVIKACVPERHLFMRDLRPTPLTSRV